VSLAESIVERLRTDSRPRSEQMHLLPAGPDGGQLFVVNGSRLYEIESSLAARVASMLDSRDEAGISELFTSLGIDAPPVLEDTPPRSAPVHALSLAVAQKCNMGCTYCYAEQGSFGAAPQNMELSMALRSVDLLLADKSPGSKVNLTFLGGEPLQNRSVLRAATEYAAQQASERGIIIGFSITTNGTLLKPADGEFFEQYGFAVTISLDGAAAQHDRLRPLKNGRGSFDLIVSQLAPLLRLQRRMQVSARVTVTPSNLDLRETLDLFVDMGFHSVGFSPLLRAPNGRDELDAPQLENMLTGMVECGLKFEQQVLKGQRYPFLNMVNALKELHRGSHRPYPCGAGVGYFGVSATGELAACHRFVGDESGQLGSVLRGVDPSRQAEWLARRHVHVQSPCNRCWARYLCGGGCHHEVIARGRGACDYIRGWLHYSIQAYGRLARLVPGWFGGDASTLS
jgi:uncharacterized protein